MPLYIVGTRELIKRLNQKREDEIQGHVNAIEKLESKFLKILEENKELSNTGRIQGEKITKLETNMKKLQSSHNI